MTTDEARTKISEQFISGYYEWLDDIKKLSDHDYGWKYGWGKPQTEIKDNQTAIIKYQKFMNCLWGTSKTWESRGYERQLVWSLVREKFLSEQLKKRETYYYISQNTAKQIYKAHKA